MFFSSETFVLVLVPGVMIILYIIVSEVPFWKISIIVERCLGTHYITFIKYHLLIPSICTDTIHRTQNIQQLPICDAKLSPTKPPFSRQRWVTADGRAGQVTKTLRKGSKVEIHMKELDQPRWDVSAWKHFVWGDPWDMFIKHYLEIRYFFWWPTIQLKTGLISWWPHIN